MFRSVRRIPAGALCFLSFYLVFSPLAGHSEDADRVGALLEKLKAQDAIARQAAARGLGEMKDERAVQPLSAALKDADWGVRREAAQALAKVGKAGLPPLVAALKDDDWVTRQEAAKGLGAMGPVAVAALIAALKDPDWRLRSGAATALGQIKDARAVGPLIVTLNDKDQLVHQAAATALGGIGEPAIAPLIATMKDADWRVVYGAVEAVAKVGAPAIGPLAAATRDETHPNRWAAAWALEIIGTPEAEKTVDEFLQGRSLAEVAQQYSYRLRKSEPNTEYLLILALERFGHPTGYGYPRMAQDFLNCGNPMLMEAGRRWAVRYKYEVLLSPAPAATPKRQK